MEAVLAAHPAVAECAVIGVADELKGHVPRGLVVLKAGAGTEPSAAAAELVAAVRAEIGPVAALRRVDVVAALPKTRSGKILRRTTRDRRWRRPTGAVHDRGSDGPRAAHAGTTRLTLPCRSLLTEVRGHARNEGIGNALPPVLAAHHGRVVAIQHVAALHDDSRRPRPVEGAQVASHVDSVGADVVGGEKPPFTSASRSVRASSADGGAVLPSPRLAPLER